MNTLTLELYDKIMAVQVAELSCTGLTVIRITPQEGKAGRLLPWINNPDCKIWFSKTGFQFEPSRDGYDAIGSSCVARCGRIIDSVDDLVKRINKAPYETPYLPEWGPVIFEALAQSIKPMTGLNPRGNYLAKEFLPRHLDEKISSLIKRKILTF